MTKLADVGWSLIKTKEIGIKLLKLTKLSQDKHNLPAVNFILSCLLQAQIRSPLTAFKFQDSVWFPAPDDGDKQDNVSRYRSGWLKDSERCSLSWIVMGWWRPLVPSPAWASHAGADKHFPAAVQREFSWDWYHLWTNGHFKVRICGVNNRSFRSMRKCGVTVPLNGLLISINSFWLLGLSFIPTHLVHPLPHQCGYFFLFKMTKRRVRRSFTCKRSLTLSFIRILAIENGNY